MREGGYTATPHRPPHRSFNPLKTKLAVAAVLFALAGSCRPSGPSGITPNFTVTPTALEMRACPTKDESGNTVNDVFPAEEKVTIRNDSRVAGPLQVSFRGDDKAAFSVSPTADVTDITGSQERELPIRFSPSRKGDLRAELVIDDGSAETKEAVVTLVGIGKNLAANPKLEVVPQNKDLLTFPTPCFEGGVCQLELADTLFKESATLDLKLRNIGCPALKITGIEIVPYPGSTGTNLAFFLEAPAIPPSSTTPLVMTEGIDNGEVTAKVRFSPEDDGSGDTQRYALMRITANDPSLSTNGGVFEVLLYGAALKPDLFANPTFCDFTNGPCGTTAKGATTTNFELKNYGNAGITVEKVEFASNGSATSGSGNRFTIPTSIVGQTIAPTTGTLNLTVNHADQPLYVTDQITVTAKVTGQASGTAGRVILTVAGGKLPCLETEPADTLSFQDPQTELSAKEVTIRNKNDPSCGELQIGKIATDTSPFFSVIDPTSPPGTKLQYGQTATATIQYKKPVSGGTQAGVLRIPTNDPTYPLSGKVVYLYSNSPLNQLPVAVVEGCLPTDTACAMAKSPSMSVNLSQLTPKTITITGKSSYDPGNPSPATAITKYQFRLVRKPTNAANASLANDGMQITAKQTTLTLDPAALGLYQVTLMVTDDSGQNSAIAGDLKINVNP
jgi:hypothetical protein